ncbi:MAG TPA: type II toxin-antitoxin system PemK/MazF family toxin [Gemmataceae bacterium]|nr:type II toxin-antitoxin system PemK/MazF family toxin [Gemmataceae bacterium]
MPSTTNYQAGELVLIDFPFTTGAQSKVRPALMLLDAGGADILVARITTQSVTTLYDVPLTDWQQAGLLAPSAVRLHKLVTSAKHRVNRLLGRLTSQDHQTISAVLLQTFGSW